MNKRKVWVEPLFAEAKDWHGMRRFRLRRLWRVNCEALVTAAGQNLKRLLQKRGWGRRPFPAEAGALTPPADWEPELSRRHNRWKSDRPSIAVASLLACRSLRTVVELQTGLFSLHKQQKCIFYTFIIYILQKIQLLLMIAFTFFFPSRRIVELSHSSIFS